MRDCTTAAFLTHLEECTSNDTFTLVLMNTRSLSKHVVDISKDQRLINNDFICLTETQMKITQPVYEVSEQLQMFNMYFNNNENQYLSIAYGYSQSISVLDHTDHPGFSEVRFLKSSFAKPSFTLMILYRKNSQSLESFS